MTDKHVHANPVRGRFNSWLLAKYEDDFHEEMGERKQQHIGALNGTVVEIGAGNGVNFRYYPPGVRLIVYEPNPWMHERLRQAAGKYGLDLPTPPRQRGTTRSARTVSRCRGSRPHRCCVLLTTPARSSAKYGGC